MADIAWPHEILDLCAAGEGEKFAAFFADDGFAEDVGRGERFEGRAAIAKWIAPTPEFIADAHFEIDSALSDGERFALQWRFSGTWIANGKTFENRGASLGQLRGGLITSWSDYTNPARFAEQVGSPVRRAATRQRRAPIARSGSAWPARSPRQNVTRPFRQFGAFRTGAAMSAAAPVA